MLDGNLLLRQKLDEVPEVTLSCPDRTLAVFHHDRHYEGLRLLPTVCDSKLIQQTLTIQDIKTSKEYENLDLQDKEKLPFTLSDIEYIIIKNESERKDIIKAINKIKSEKDSLDILKSKILTVKQIEQDF